MSLGILVAAFFLFLRFYGVLIVFQSLRSYLRQPGLFITASALACGALPAQFGNEQLLQSLTTSSLPLLLSAAFAELLIGAVIGLPLALVFESFTMAGRVADLGRGAQFGEQLNPVLGAQVTPFENLAAVGILAAALSYGAHELLLDGVYQSLSAGYLAIGSGVPAVAAIVDRLSLAPLLQLSSKVIGTGVALAAPVLVLGILLDVATAVLSRVLGRVNVLFEVMPLKMMLGILVIAWMVATQGIGVPQVAHDGVLLERQLVKGDKITRN